MKFIVPNFSLFEMNTDLQRINPFVVNAQFLYPLETSENLTIFWYIQGVEKGSIGNNRIKLLRTNLPIIQKPANLFV